MTGRRSIWTRLMSAAVLLVPALVVSCTMVVFTGDPIESFSDMKDVEKSHMTKIDFDILWPELAEQQVPEHLTVVMNRIQNSRAHYVYHLDGEGNVLDIPADSIPSVQNGFYSIAAVAVADEADLDKSVIEMFEDSLDVSMKDVYVNIPKLTKEEKVEKQYVDYNPVYPYIKTVSPFYYVRPSVKTHIEIWTNRGEEIKTVELKPMPLTRKVTLKVPLDLEEGVKVERLIGALSGVPSSVQLMTGYVSDHLTGKVPVEMTSADGKNFEGTINIFGLFPPEEASQIAGKGILTLTIHVVVEDGGARYKHAFYYNVNMKEQIEAAEIMILTEDRSAYRFSDTEMTDDEGEYLQIKEFSLSVKKEDTDEITRRMVITGKGQGFNKWKPVEDNDNIEVNPGLHPEV